MFLKKKTFLHKKFKSKLLAFHFLVDANASSTERRFKKSKANFGFLFSSYRGGVCGNQTRDLRNANAALYQLS